MIPFENYSRDTFNIRAVQVTRENIKEVADYASTQVQIKRTTVGPMPYFKIPVSSPNRPDTTVSIDVHIGDWLTQSDSSLYRYTAKKFPLIFTKIPPPSEADLKLKADILTALQDLPCDAEKVDACAETIFRILGLSID